MLANRLFILKKMREIKFKIYEKIWHSEEWQMNDNKGKGFFLWELHFMHTKYSDDKMKVLQYTGFKDFDGKEIYEGDILEYVSYMRDENKRKEIVELDEKCGGWYVHKQADTLADVLFKQHNEEWQIKQNYTPSLKHKVRIIGNIYENPELTQTTS